VFLFIYLKGSPNFKDLKKYMWEGFFSGYLKLGVLGVWMTCKKAEMAKTLRNCTRFYKKLLLRPAKCKQISMEIGILKFGV
jgi:hypothetical protein